MLLLAQTAAVALFVGRVYVDVDYIKQAVQESKMDRGALHESLRTLDVAIWKANQCSDQIKELQEQLAEHTRKEK